MTELATRVQTALRNATERLLAERNAAGHWRGELASSALSTATAIIALSTVSREENASRIRQGLSWLAKTQCPNGGWGDTAISQPNISTTLLCWSAFGAAGPMASEFAELVRRCEEWIARQAGGISPANLAGILIKRYGKDQTFSVPILMACALGGRLGAAPECWKLVPQLPFQLATLPRSWFAALNLTVVSYALPALIAIGQARHFHAPTGPARLLRRAAQASTLRLLEEIQPSGGGFLEATPLTSFVGMALASMGLAAHRVTRECLGFLHRSQRRDGSWPIDTDLATWGTTLSVKALAGDFPGASTTLTWLLGQQSRVIHPYTLSAPGGWAWSDLPGALPDADDTSGALLALKILAPSDSQPVRDAATAGVKWLLGLQNRDGGVPTFCRGWGKLPFDRSTPEITSHALAAWRAWPDSDPRIPAATRKAFAYLAKVQQSDGSWIPLWFGNEWTPTQTNPVYGTAAVLRDLSDFFPVSGAARSAMEITNPELSKILAKATSYLLSQQHADGTWGGPRENPHPSIEETALSLHALAKSPTPAPTASLQRATEALLDLTENGQTFPAAPIGLYFAQLWYHEKLYPMVFTLSALREVARRGLGES